jgi:hypothetical protein
MSAMFEFSGGALSVTPDPNETYVTFQLFNVGDEAGVAEVGVEVDDEYVNTWTSESLAPSVGANPWVSLGQVAEGTHVAVVYVNPGSGQNDHLRQSFTVPAQS